MGGNEAQAKLQKRLGKAGRVRWKLVPSHWATAGWGLWSQKESTLLLFVEVARYQGSNKGFSYTHFSAWRAENKSGVNRVLFILILIEQ